MERKKTIAKRTGKPSRVGSAGEALAGAAPTGSPSQHNSAQPVCSILENPPSSVRNILANCGHPIEEIIKKILIPKLHAKETKFVFAAGKVETRVVDDHQVQLKTALELAKMCGCYTAEKVEMKIDQTNPVDMRRASDDDLRTILEIAARIEKEDSARQG